MTTGVMWRIFGQQTERVTNVPDGEDYKDWIAQAWGVDREKIEILAVRTIKEES